MPRTRHLDYRSTLQFWRDMCSMFKTNLEGWNRSCLLRVPLPFGFETPLAAPTSLTNTESLTLTKPTSNRHVRRLNASLIQEGIQSYGSFDQVAGSQPPSLDSNFKPHCYRGVIQCHLIPYEVRGTPCLVPCTPTIHLQTLSGIGIQPSHPDRSRLRIIIASPKLSLPSRCYFGHPLNPSFLFLLQHTLSSIPIPTSHLGHPPPSSSGHNPILPCLPVPVSLA